MKILFAFENPLPSPEADAEVFITTARHLSAHLESCALHVPAASDQDLAAIEQLAGMPVVRARAPVKPAALRHIACGLTLPFRRAFREADLIYTRNLWIAWMSVLFGQRVVFDHYRPWPDQIPPLQFLIYRLLGNRRFIVNICHSDYTASIYAALGVPKEKLVCIHNGYDPSRVAQPMPVAVAKRAIGLDPGTPTVVYTGRVNHKKGLELVVEAAKAMPEVHFLFVGSYGDGPIERLAAAVPNVHVIGWQSPQALAPYIFAADALLIPPSQKPLSQFGSTVLPLKLFLYLAAGRPIVAGQTPDIRELLEHGRNAWLCPPDDAGALVDALRAVLSDPALAARISAEAQRDSEALTWSARATRIAATIAARLEAPVARGRWGGVQFRNWRRQSQRWLSHLVRTRSWVLPPQDAC